MKIGCSAPLLQGKVCVMKFKPLLLPAAAAMLLSWSALPAFADNEEEKTFTSPDGMYVYGVNEDGDAEIYDLIDEKSYSDEIVIPSEIDGHTVVYVGNGAFTDADGVTSVTIPATVTDMGDCVFFGCRSLSSFQLEAGNPSFTLSGDGLLLGDEGKFLICYPPGREGETYVIPDTVDEIAPGAFAFAKYLKEIIIPGSVVSVDRWAFGYSKLESVILEDGVYQLDDYAFAYCQSLHNVDLGGSLAMIYDAAFAGCRALEEITLPDSLTVVGQYAFSGTSLKSVTIPWGVEEIGYGAFGYDSELKPISSFTVHAVEGSVGHAYCTAEDPDNDYQNHFNFVAVKDPDAPDFSSETEESVTEDSSGDPREETKPQPPPRQKEDNSLLTILLVAGTGIIVLLAAVLAVVLRKKPEEEKKAPDEEDEA